MNTTNASTADAARLGRARRVALQSCSELLAVLNTVLSEKDRAASLEVLSTGGRVGIEVLVDAKGETHVSLVAVELEGMLRRIASIEQQKPSAER
jgi:hypothetical protein